MTALSAIMTGTIQRLRYTYRYSAQPVVFRENVAEHSFWTAMIASTIAIDVYQDKTLAESCALRGLFHDIEECMTGDLVRELKYWSPELREAVRQAEVRFAEGIFGDLGDVAGPIFSSVWSSAKDDSLEGEIVSVADALCVISYCLGEEAMGNFQLGHILSEVNDLIDRKVEAAGKSHPELARYIDIARKEMFLNGTRDIASGS